MAVYKRGQIYHYEFEHRGDRFRGSTGCKAREPKSSSPPSGKRRRRKPNIVKLSAGALTWGARRHVTGRAREAAGRNPHIIVLARMADARDRGARRSPILIVPYDRLVAKRRGDGVGPGDRRSDVIEPLCRVLDGAQAVGRSAPRSIEWRKHLIEGAERTVRRTSGRRGGRAVCRVAPDYRPIVRFAFSPGAASPSASAWLAGHRLGRAGDPHRALRRRRAARPTAIPLASARAGITLAFTRPASRKGTLLRRSTPDAQRAPRERAPPNPSMRG